MTKKIILKPSIFGTSYYCEDGTGPLVRVTMSQASVVPDGLMHWYKRTDPQVIQDHMDDTAWKGTQIHGWIELYLKGEDDIAIQEWAIPAMSFFEEWAKKVKLKAKHTEIKLPSTNLGLGGTCDVVGSMTGSPLCIIDFKTGQTNDKHFCQLALYMYMYWENTGELVKDLYIVGVHRDGKPITLKKCPDPLKYLRAAFLAYERWKFDNEEKLMWGAAPNDLWENRRRSRGKNRIKYNELWEPKFRWQWLEKDCLLEYEEFKKIYESA